RAVGPVAESEVLGEDDDAARREVRLGGGGRFRDLAERASRCDDRGSGGSAPEETPSSHRPNNASAHGCPSWSEAGAVVNRRAGLRSGLVICANCGNVLNGTTRTKRSDDGLRYKRSTSAARCASREHHSL